jgi:hypothetical protein
LLHLVKAPAAKAHGFAANNMAHLQNIYKYRVLRDQGHPFFTFTCVEDLFWCSGNCNRTRNPRLAGFGPQTDGFGELESFSVEAIANDSYWFLNYLRIHKCQNSPLIDLLWLFIFLLALAL